MSTRLDIGDRTREDRTPAAAAVREPGSEATDHVELPDATVFPSPLLTLAAGGVGALIGFATIYLLVALQITPIVGAAVVVVLFAMALSGPTLLADARTEAGRAVAVVLDGIAFGGTLGGLAVLLLF